MSSRSTGGFVALASAFVVLTAGCSADGAPGASPGGSTAAGSGAYLALGDSVPFGFWGGSAADFSDAENFVGYPELVGEELGLDVINASCPGETTASFLDATAQSNGCENSLQSDFGYRTAFPLHVPYESADQSQLDFAVETLTDNEDVELVTLQIGANDAFICQQTTPGRCTAPADLQALAQTLEANVDRILSTLRGEGGYDGQIVVVTYYALDYSGATAPSTQVLDSGIAAAAQANGAIVASGYDAFRPTATGSGGSSVDGGLVVPGDVHPTEQGQRLLARAVEDVVPR
jgi:lysophospholipase L1-like esterase